MFGPGLDFTDKRNGYDFYPIQTLQPFALIDSLRRLGIASSGGPSVAIFDLSSRVINHVKRAVDRAVAGGAYLVEMPLDDDVPWFANAKQYWSRFGSEIGAEAPAVKPPRGLAVKARAVRIRPEVVKLIWPVDLNVVCQQEALADLEKLDLAIATNVLVYYSVFEQTLAMLNIARMLKPGGVLLCNNALPQTDSVPLRLAESAGGRVLIDGRRCGSILLLSPLVKPRFDGLTLVRACESISRQHDSCVRRFQVVARNARLSMALAFALLARSIYAQQATGSITGTVSDSSGAIVPGASVTITNKSTGGDRSLTTNAEGLFSAPGLEAGQYHVRTEHQGFRTVERDAEVQAGSPTTVNIALQVGASSEVINVEAATAEINYESHAITGVIEHQSIENLPLNGRSFLQLASLEPGVRVVVQSQGVRNAPIGISILGGGGQYALVTMDGLSIADYHDGYAGAGTSINFSQEVVQEFQLSSANFDLSTLTTLQGAINLVTRSGGNDFHGSGFFFYRDHNIAAYPGLKRNSFNPNPFFARRNPGGTFSGPIVKDKIFFFGSHEYTNQAGVVTVQPDLASIAGGAGIYPSPFHYHYTTVRFDYRVSPKHNVFLRWTNDQNTGFGVTGGAVFPSQWVGNYNWSDQIALGVTSTMTPAVVGEFRFGYRMWENNESFPSAAQCGNPCIGGPVPGLAPNGLPQLTMQGSSISEPGTTDWYRRIASSEITSPNTRCPGRKAHTG